MIYDITSDQLRDPSASDLTLTRCEHLMLTPPNKSVPFDAPEHDKHDGTKIATLRRFLAKLFLKTRNRILALGALDLTLRGHQLT